MDYSKQIEIIDNDYSPYLIHFTNNRDSLLSILWKNIIEARNPFGAARKQSTKSLDSQRCVCLTETPIHFLSKFFQSRKSSSYGIGFKKEYLRNLGANPVWYIHKESYLKKLLDSMIGEEKDPESLIWYLTPFIDFPGVYQRTRYEFE